MNSRFLSRETAAMTPYTPGEQPRDRKFIKLNTNECPYAPSPRVEQALREFASETLRLYPDPDSTAFTQALAEEYGLQPNQVLACGGSDESLAFAFMAFCDRGSRVWFPDITYGFYIVYANLFGLKPVQVPLREDFSLVLEDYCDADGMTVIANPNAPTGMVLHPNQIEEFLKANPNRLVLVDEAYGDFAPGYSCVPLIDKYDNLLVIRTFSKSRALAGMRLGVALGNAALIDGMNRIKYSFNPYNLDRVSTAVGMAALSDRADFKATVGRVIATRERTAQALEDMGFIVLSSQSNFLFVCHPERSGETMYTALRERGILVRYFNKPRIDRFIRVTIGTDEEMQAFLQALEEIR